MTLLLYFSNMFSPILAGQGNNKPCSPNTNYLIKVLTIIYIYSSILDEFKSHAQHVIFFPPPWIPTMWSVSLFWTYKIFLTCLILTVLYLIFLSRAWVMTRPEFYILLDVLSTKSRYSNFSMKIINEQKTLTKVGQNKENYSKFSY